MPRHRGVGTTTVLLERWAGLGGSAADVQIQAGNLHATLDRMRGIIARHTGHSMEEMIGWIGAYRRSPVTQLWYAGPHRLHLRGA